jgi:hypothetical protein
MDKPKIGKGADRHPWALVIALGLVVSACSDDGGEAEVWNGDSVAIEFVLKGAVGQTLCEFSTTREELTEAQRAGLRSLKLRPGEYLGSSCDFPNYAIVIHAADGSSANYRAVDPRCDNRPILLFDDFDAWAKSTSCSLER